MIPILIASLRHRLVLAVVAFLPVFAIAQPQPNPPPRPNPPPPQNNPPPPNPGPGGFGVPLTGLGDTELAAFLDGGAEFRVRKGPADGLGPIFNDNACVACHDQPAPGGGSRRRVTRFGRLDAGGTFDPLADLGGSLLEDRALRGVPLEVIPTEANVVARRITPPLFGDGLIEAIPDATILANAQAPKPAGIHGRAALVVDVTTGTQRVGRFGWKAQDASLLEFSADASVNEMGITNRFFPHENAPNGNTAAIARFTRATLDDPIDPTDGRTGIDRLADFMRLLAPPPRAPARGNSTHGEQLFTALDCAACHTPTMNTGANPVAALSRRPVNLFSDLLLHDMGSLGDGIAQGAAGPTEMRTAPLWGLRTRRDLLHDGRAATVDAAIRAHDGEAAGARDAYANLSSADRQALLDFLNTL